MKTPAAIVLLLCSTLLSSAQTRAPQPENAGFPFKNTSLLTPPAGAKVALFEFEDLECPLCAADAPIVRKAVVAYKIPYERHDLPLTEIHIWSFDAAVTARYLQDKVSPAMAEQFRLSVFANQARILSKDDLARFTRTWFAAHGQNLPFVLDSTGACRTEVQSDRALADRLNVRSTPCIFVVTHKKWVHVTDISQLYRILDQAVADTSANGPTVPRRTQPTRP